MNDKNQKNNANSESDIFEQIVNISEDLVFLQDIEGKYLFAKGSGLQRYIKEDIIGKYPEEIFTKENSEIIISNLKDVIYSGKSKIIEIKMKHNGEYLYFTHFVTPLFDEDGVLNMTLTILKDITNQKNADIALKQSEERLRTLINAMPDLVIFKDSFGNWLEANDYALQNLNLINIDYRGKKDSELAGENKFYMDTLLNCEITDEIAWKNGKLTKSEEIIIQKDGTQKVFDILKIPLFNSDNSRKGIVVLGKDITNFKLVDETREKYADLLKKLSDSAMTFIESDISDNIYYLISDNLKKLIKDSVIIIFSYDKELNKLKIESINSEDDEIINTLNKLNIKIKDYEFNISDNFINKFFNDKINVITEIQSNLRNNIFENEHLNSILDKLQINEIYSFNFRRKNEIFGIGTVLLKKGHKIIESDVLQTFVKQASIALQKRLVENTILKSKNELRDANIAKDKFFSIIAHDLKNPFLAITGFSDILSAEYDNLTDDEIKLFIQNIKTSSSNAYKLLQNLLEWSRTQTGRIPFQPEFIDLSVLTNEIIQFFRSQADSKKIKISSGIMFNTKVYSDENMVKVILRNLLSNAIKFTNINGHIKIFSKQINSMLELHIKDNGVGISEENINKLFSIEYSFNTLGTDNEEGTGLGLVICKEMVKKNGGEIIVNSKLNEGSDFIITLPTKIFQNNLQ